MGLVDPFGVHAACAGTCRQLNRETSASTKSALKTELVAVAIERCDAGSSIAVRRLAVSTRPC
jgi:hypothetical protein